MENYNAMGPLPRVIIAEDSGYTGNAKGEGGEVAHGKGKRPVALHQPLVAEINVKEKIISHQEHDADPLPMSSRMAAKRSSSPQLRCEDKAVMFSTGDIITPDERRRHSFVEKTLSSHHASVLQARSTRLPPPMLKKRMTYI